MWRKQSTVVENVFWTLLAFVMDCIAFRISPKSRSAVHFSAVTNIYLDPAHAPFGPDVVVSAG